MVSINLYSRQFFFFLGVTALLIGAVWVVKNQTGHAAGRPITIPTGSDSLAIDMVILDHGQVALDRTTVPGAIGFFKHYDELRYLLIDQSDTFLNRLEIMVHFLRPVEADQAKATAIINHDLGATWQATWRDATTLVYTVENLGPTGSLTLIAAVPKGVIVPSWPQRIFGTIDNLPQIIWLSLALILPLLALLILGIVLGPQIRQRLATTTAERPTPPSDDPPGLVTALVDGRVSARAIAATLLDLARRDYIDIGSHDGTYTFTKRRRLLSTSPPDGTPTDLAPFEQILLSKIFSTGPQVSKDDIQVRIGDRLFSHKVATVYLGMYDAVTRLGYFIKNPAAVAGSYRLAGLSLFFFSILGFLFGAIFYADPPTPLLFWIGTIGAAWLIITLAPRLPAHTPAGLARRQDWLAFRNYLKSSQALSYQTQTQNQFFAYLPLAVALGVEAAWAARFLDAPFQLPDWYSPQAKMVRWEDFLADMFPIVGYLAQELAAVKEPTLS